MEAIIAAAALKGIAAGTSIERVIAAIALEQFMATATTVDDVVACSTTNRVVIPRPGPDRIVAIAALEELDNCRSPRE